MGRNIGAPTFVGGLTTESNAVTRIHCTDTIRRTSGGRDLCKRDDDEKKGSQHTAVVAALLGGVALASGHIRTTALETRDVVKSGQGKQQDTNSKE